MEPHNFSMFLGNSKLNHFDAKTIKNDMAKMVDGLNERTRIPIDMFKKDFFFLPICMRDHWFGVTVIDPGGAIVGGKKARKKSTILILDSLRKHINHNHTKWNIRAFLTLLFKALQSYTKIHAHLSYDYNWIDMNNQLPLPIQPNTYDCGIYMLMFYQLFVDSLPTKEDPLVLRNKWDTMDSDKYRMVIHDRIVTVGGFKDFALPSLYRRTDPRKFRRKKRREELKNSAPSYEPVVPVAAEESSSAYSLV
uniref:ULP_PROTEASE domain-containing protein n=1 Tax=Panagrellus redivivus TaxID=6233 RepID=A0A7E4VDF5_PANRE